VKSKLARAGLAAVCALGATIATITPAHAASASASYNCGTFGNPIKVTFTRTAPTTPPSKNLKVAIPASFTAPAPILPGSVAAVLGGSPPYPITVTNPTTIPAGPVTTFTLTGPSPSTLGGPPTTIGTVLSGNAVTCTLLGTPAPSGWPI